MSNVNNGNNKYINFSFSIIGHSLCHFLMLILPTIAIFIEGAFGLSFSNVIMLSLISCLLFGFGALPAGWLADKWNAPSMLVIYFIGSGISAILCGLSQSPLELMICLSIMGLFASIYHPVGTAWVIEFSENKGKALALNSWAGNLGVAAAALVCTFLAAKFSWRVAFFLPGVLSLAVGLLLLVYLQLNKSLLQSTTSVPKAVKDYNQTVEKNTRFYKHSFICLVVAMVGTGMIYSTLSISLPKIYHNMLSDLAESSYLGIGGFISLSYIIASFSHFVGGYFINRYNPRFVYMTFYLLLIPLFMLATQLNSFGLWLCITMGVFLHTGASPAEKILVYDYSPKRKKATSFGIRFMLGICLGEAIKPLVSTYLNHEGGYFWAMLTVVLICIFIIAAVNLLPSRNEKLTPEDQGETKLQDNRLAA